MVGLINIIVPVYNSEKYIGRCLQSIFNQTYKLIHVYVVNDGSIDSSLSIISDFKHKHINMTIINKPNGGLSSARNAGLQRITDYSGTYIMFVDSDDCIESHYCERMIEVMKKVNTDILCSGFTGFNDKGVVHTMDNHFGDIKYDVEEGLKALFCGDILSQAQTKLYKSELWKDFYFDENIRFMEDQAIMFKLFYKSRSIYYFNNQGYYYYYSANSLIRSKLTNYKIISALNAYYEAIIFEYNLPKSLEIINCAKNCFASAFLMLSPRFDKKNEQKELLEKYFFYERYVKETKLIKYANFNNKKDRKKRALYLFSPSLLELYIAFILGGVPNKGRYGYI